MTVPEIPAVIDYTIHVRPVDKLEVLGLKTELVAGSEPVPFGVAGYDAEENEFDTLDGLQLSWYVHIVERIHAGQVSAWQSPHCYR